MRVKTTEGNVFYTHKAKKASVWTVPEEIQEAVELLEQEEEQQAVKAEEDSKIAREGAAKRLEDEQLQEVERIRAEVQDMVKRKAEDDPVPTAAVTKKQKIEKEEDSDESEEEDWQREAAAQLALEAEIEAERRKKEEEEQKASEEAEVKRLKEMQINMPARVDLSIEEAKALFKVTFLQYASTLLYVDVLHDTSRLYLGKRTSTHCILGTSVYLNSFPTHDMCSSRRFRPVVKLSMNTVATGRVNCGN